MYSVKEKLNYFRRLTNPLAAEADLALLQQKNPQSTDFVRFNLAPKKNADDILFALLDVCSHEEIVRNRRKFFSKQKDGEGPEVVIEGKPDVPEVDGPKTDADGKSETPKVKEPEPKVEVEPVDGTEETQRPKPTASKKKKRSTQR